MAGQNQFYPHATGAGANVLTNAAWAALTARQGGFQAGIASSSQVNAALRQGTVMSSMIGAFIAAHNLDALDNGDLVALRENFEAALETLVGSQLPGAAALWHFGTDTSATATRLVANVSPDIAAYAAGIAYSIVTANASVAGGTQANFDGRGLRPVTNRDGSAIQVGDWGAGDAVVLIDDGTRLQLVNRAIVIPPAVTFPEGAYVHYGPDTSASATSVVANVSPDISAYAAGHVYLTKTANASANGSTTANFDGRGAKPVKRLDGTAIQAGDWRSGQIIVLVDDGTNFQLINRAIDDTPAVTFPEGAYVHSGTDTSATATAIVANITPDITAYAVGHGHLIKVANASANGGTTANLDGRGARPVKRLDGTAIQAGDWRAGQVIVLVDDGTNLQLANRLIDDTPAVTYPDTAYVHSGTDTSATANRLVANVSPDVAAYAAGITYNIRAANASVSGGTQANFDGLGLRPVKNRDGSAIVAGDWGTGDVLVLVDDGTNLQLINRAIDIPAPVTYPAVALWHAGTAAGTASAVTVASLNPAITAYADQLPVFITFPNGVADGATIKFGALATIPIQRNDGSAIQAADIPVGSGALFNFYGTSALRLSSLGRGEVQRIAINPVLYVSPSGSDTTGDGTSSKPYRQIAAALLAGTSRFSFASSQLTISMADGTYDPPGTIPRGTGTIQLLGNPASPGNVIIAGPDGGGANALILVQGVCNLNGLTIRNTGTTTHTFATIAGGVSLLQNCAFEATASGNPQSHLFTGGTTNVAGGCTFAGDMGTLTEITGGPGRCSIVTGVTATLIGTPAYAVATAYARDGGQFVMLAGTSFAGSATGTRYRIRDTVINVNGAGANAIPGDAAGIIVSGGFGAYRP